MKYSLFYRDCNPSRKPRKWIWVALFIVAHIAVIGWVKNKERNIEIAKQMECEPVIEMTMPIEPDRVRA